jgi:hypothetical protein
MDILVMLDENPGHSPMLAHVNSMPSPLHTEQPARDVVTLYGAPSAEALAMALAAVVEGHRGTRQSQPTIRHVGIWPERGALGDEAWRDAATGRLITRDVDIPLADLRETSRQLLAEFGQLIRRLVAGLAMPDWPEGARRAITFSLHPVAEANASSRTELETVLDRLREADALGFDIEGD